MNNAFINTQGSLTQNQAKLFSAKNSLKAPTGKKSFPAIFQNINFYIFLFSGILLIFNIVRPPFLDQKTVKDIIINKIDRLSKNINETENITVLKRLTTLNIENLKVENEIQSKIYNSAVEGDYALIVGDYLAIYRHNEDKLIYDGLSPDAEYKKLIDETTKNIINVAKSQNIVGASEETLQPAILFISSANISATKEIDTQFYKDILVGDVIASFNDKKLIIIFRPTEQKIINSATISTSLDIK